MSGVSVRLGNRLSDEYCAGINLTWECMRAPICQHAWDELYEGQKDEWISLMDNPANLSSRVWVSPYEQVIELRYERYCGLSYHLTYSATFVIISDFDSFRYYCPGARQIREGVEIEPCLPML